MTVTPAVDVLKPKQIALIFRCNEKSALRWLHDGRLPGWRTPGGHWRASASAVRAALIDGGAAPADADRMIAAVLGRQVGGA